MVLPLILILAGVLLFVIIGYNILQQYRQKVEAEKRATIVKQKAVIEETDEMLLQASRLPFSKELLLILHQRVYNALQAIAQVDPTLGQVKQRLNDITGQISNIQQNYQAPPSDSYRSPDNDKQALLMLQVIKKIRAIVRSEHSKGKVETPVYVMENRRLELMQLKINLENAIARAQTAKMNRQFGTVKQLLDKAITTLSGVPDRDAYLQSKLEQMEAMKAEMNSQLKTASDTDLKERQEKEVDELDVLFQPKKKW
ncbi:hypothetical protein [Motilimonas sp. E26]|uniref:hypothetical protein n=1 Tax=Motilimonas TaxID=1914248 RepID=UPI001E541113|nr:hypothetical protein [Motilimonas sp. E26]MCE0556975.1 hypothetical protein [Motilimonas sp. E26]